MFAISQKVADKSENDQSVTLPSILAFRLFGRRVGYFMLCYFIY
jgi:hypothetical protein